MQLEYIDDNLQEIMANPDSVLYLKPYDIKNKKALFAIVKGQNGIYKKLQITKEQSKLSFPFEPIYWFYQGPGYLYLKDFIVLDNWLALNTTNLDGFRSYKIDDYKKYNMAIYALFSDGSATFITRENEKKYNKNGHLDSYYNLLKQYKEPNIQQETYYCIDNYINERNTIVIPELLAPKDLELKKLNYEELKLQPNGENETTAPDRVVIPPEAVHESVKVLSRIKKDKKR